MGLCEEKSTANRPSCGAVDIPQLVRSCSVCGMKRASLQGKFCVQVAQAQAWRLTRAVNICRLCGRLEILPLNWTRTVDEAIAGIGMT
jgi:hypothetical protein